MTAHGTGGVLSALPASTLTRMLRDKQVSSRELLACYEARIERLDPAINAVITTDFDDAYRQAAEADALTARGSPRGALHGLPVTVKDTIETAGMRTTAGSTTLLDHVPTRDADAVARLRAAGAIIFGKTNTPTFAGDIQTHNEVAGTTHNPWCHTKTAGGSSGGSAAAVAASLTGLDIGSDLAGSLRLPAHYCGVFALRPSYATVSTRGHIPRPPGWRTTSDMATIGPIARSADDLKLGLDAIAGPSPIDAPAWRLELPPSRINSLHGSRIGIWADDPFCPVDAEIVTAIDTIAAQAHSHGARIDPDTRPVKLSDAHALFQQLMFGTTNTSGSHDDFARHCANADALTPHNDSPPARILRASTQRLRTWHFTNEQRATMQQTWNDYFTHHDILICPTAPTTAINHNHTQQPITINGHTRDYWDQTIWSSPAAVAHLPAAVIPIGLNTTGLPISIQIIGNHLHDHTVTQAAELISTLNSIHMPQLTHPTRNTHQ
ncbi:MAG TPA: amidase [Candidatus Stackebrandtia faecavium]|nr:amidase [Candidatus Stackebrandtia faecavium]